MKILSKLKYKSGGMISSLILVAAVALTGAFFSNNTFADDASKTALTLSPMSQKILLTPGETYEGTIKVVNGASSTGKMDYQTVIGSYVPTHVDGGKDSYGGVDVVTRSNYNMIMDWATIDNPTGTLEPNSTVVVTYKIAVPEDAPAGAQYMTIIASDTTSKDNNGVNEGVSIESKYQLASIIYANVAGETVEKGSITENAMPSVLTNSKLEATSMVKNEGNIYTDATYTLQVWPMFSDEEICTNEEKSETSMVLPETERYHVQTCNLPAVGIFKAKQVVKIFGEESVLEKTIIVCPIWLMIVILAILLAIIIAIVVIIKKHSKKSRED